MYEDNKKQKRIILLAGIGTLIVVAFLIYLAIKNIVPSTGATFYIVPDKVALQISPKDQPDTIIKKTVQYKTHLKLSPGEYSATLSHPDFNTETINFTIIQNQLTPVALVMKPSTPQGEALLQDKIYRQRIEGVSGLLLDQTQKEIETTYPFINQLPISSKFYTIDACYGPDKQQPFGLCVELFLDNPTQRKYITQDIKNLGKEAEVLPVYWLNPSN